MSTKSNIEWTERTWNPLAGCTRVSHGCNNCYAAVMALRLEAMAKKDIAQGKAPGGKRKYIDIATRTPSGKAAFNGTINLDYAALAEPLSWKKPQMIFVNSMSDLFHKDVPTEFIDKTFGVMTSACQHTFQVLTKRPDRMANYIAKHLPGIGITLTNNIWFGTSVENQEEADKRVPELLKIREMASVLFLSMEPLLGPIHLDKYYKEEGAGAYSLWIDYLDWVIVGGESGRDARPMHPDWARSIRDQCVKADVPFFFKQRGEWTGEYHDLPEELQGRVNDGVGKFDMVTMDDGLPMYKFGKRAAGRLLDGVEWNQMPR